MNNEIGKKIRSDCAANVSDHTSSIIINRVFDERIVLVTLFVAIEHRIREEYHVR